MTRDYKQAYMNITNTIEKRQRSQKRFYMVGEKMDRANWYRTGAMETQCCQLMLGNRVARFWRREND